MGIKICKTCGKDYNEKDNLKWSCRQHMSQFSGEMWWCCGKKGQDAPGCKFSRHEERKDDEEDEDIGKDKNDLLSRVRCFCCKELGHEAEQCTRDPNIRTRENVEAEFERIAR